MSMHINFSPEMEGYIKSKVSTGFYSNATEVIRDAVRRMQIEEQRRVAFRAAVAAGDDELDRGESISYDQDALKAITDEALKGMDNEQPTDRDVLPA